MTYADDHATNPCTKCGSPPGVGCEHDEQSQGVGERRVGSAAHTAAWNAIQDYVRACGGDPDRVSNSRMDAVVKIEQAIDARAHELNAAAAHVDVPAIPLCELDELEAHDRAMTTGPWALSPQAAGPDDRPRDEWVCWVEIDSPSEQCLAQCATAGVADEPNAAGIVAIRNALPHLIAEARAAVALRAERSAIIEQARAMRRECDAKIGELRARANGADPGP